MMKFDEYVKEMAPELAYKFIIPHMPDAAWEAIDKCLKMEGVTPDNLSGMMEEMFKENGYPTYEAATRILTKALEHRKWLLDLGLFDKEHKG